MNSTVIISRVGRICIRWDNQIMLAVLLDQLQWERKQWEQLELLRQAEQIKTETETHISRADRST
jgi:hypothetical protein